MTPGPIWPNTQRSQIESKDPLIARAASGATWIVLEMIGIQGMSLLVFAIIAHFVNPYDFGLISISFVFIQSVKVIIFDSIVNSIVRKPAPTSLEFSTAFWICVSSSIILSIAIIIISDLISLIMNIPDLGWIMRQMSCVILFGGLARTHEAWLTRHFQFRQLAIRALTGGLVGGGAAIGAAISGLHAEALVVQQIVTTIVSFILLWKLCPWRPQFIIPKTIAWEVISFSFNFLSSNSLSILNQNLDTILIGIFFGPSVTGLYSISKRLKLSIQLITFSPISGVLLPLLAEAGNDKNYQFTIFIRVLQSLFATSIAVYAISACLSREIISILFGSGWILASPIFSMLALSGGLTTISSVFEAILNVHGKVINITQSNLVYSAFSICLFFLWLYLGYSNIALPFVFPYGLTLIFLYRKVSLLFHMSNLTNILKSITGILGSTMIMSLAVLCTNHLLNINDVLPRLILLIIIGFTAYFISLLMLARGVLMSLIKLGQRQFFSRINMPHQSSSAH